MTSHDAVFLNKILGTRKLVMVGAGSDVVGVLPVRL